MHRVYSAATMLCLANAMTKVFIDCLNKKLKKRLELKTSRDLMAVIKLAKWIPLNFTECVFYCARNCGDYKEIKELDFSGDTDTCRKFTVKQSFKSTIQVMSQN